MSRQRPPLAQHPQAHIGITRSLSVRGRLWAPARNWWGSSMGSSDWLNQNFWPLAVNFSSLRPSRRIATRIPTHSDPLSIGRQRSRLLTHQHAVYCDRDHHCHPVRKATKTVKNINSNRPSQCLASSQGTEQPLCFISSNLFGRHHHEEACIQFD